MVGAIALERKPALRCLNTSRGSTIVIVVTPPSATSRRFASCKSGGRACSKRRHRRYLLEAEKRGEPQSAHELRNACVQEVSLHLCDIQNVRDQDFLLRLCRCAFASFASTPLGLETEEI